jgi:hypothetical protein
MFDQEIGVRWTIARWWLLFVQSFSNPLWKDTHTVNSFALLAKYTCRRRSCLRTFPPRTSVYVVDFFPTVCGSFLDSVVVVHCCWATVILNVQYLWSLLVLLHSLYLTYFFPLLSSLSLVCLPLDLHSRNESILCSLHCSHPNAAILAFLLYEYDGRCCCVLGLLWDSVSSGRCGSIRNH